MDIAQKGTRALAAALVACGLVGCGSAARGAVPTAVEAARHVYVGSLDTRPAARIALLTADHGALAYLCDNAQLADLFHGTAPDGTASLDDGHGATITAAFGDAGAEGTVSLPGQAPARFHATPATGPAGLYEANASSPTGALSGRWVVAAEIARLSDTPGQVCWPGRRLGQDNELVFGRIGRDGAGLERLRQEGVV